jgi:hypothetical protein
MTIKANIEDRTLRALMKAYPEKILKASRQLVNDMAFEFKATATDIIDKHMEVRNKGFVSPAFRMKSKNRAAIRRDRSLHRIGSHRAVLKPGRVFGLGGAGGGQSPAFMKKRPIRSIGKNARGGSMGGLLQKRARLTGDIIDMDELLDPTMPADESRTQAAIAANQGKKGRVILREGSGFTPDLYGITHIEKARKIY